MVNKFVASASHNNKGRVKKMEEVRPPSSSSSCKHATTCPYHHLNHHPDKKHSHRRHWWWWARSPPPEELVFALSYMMATSLWQLPMEYIDGNPVPTVIFHGRATTFHVFVVGLCASFSGSIAAIEFRQREPKAARYYRLFAVGSMAVTVAVFLWAAVPAGFSFICSATHA